MNDFKFYRPPHLPKHKKEVLEQFLERQNAKEGQQRDKTSQVEIVRNEVSKKVSTSLPQLRKASGKVGVEKQYDLDFYIKTINQQKDREGVMSLQRRQSARASKLMVEHLLQKEKEK